MESRNLPLTDTQIQNINRLLRSQIRRFRRGEEHLPLNEIINQSAVMAIFLSDPFEGKINPGESNGQKLFTLATAERSKESKITISQDQAVNVMNLFRQDSNSFGWGILTGCIETEDGKKLSILEDSHLLTLELVKKNAMRTFFSPTSDISAALPDKLESSTIDPAAGNAAHLDMLYRRTRTRMIAKRIQNSLTPTSWSTLFSKRKHYAWKGADGTVSYDGTTMLFLLVSGINPSTRVGVSDLKTNLRSARLVQFQYNVTDLTDKMMTDYELILEKKGNHEDIVLDLFTSLLSGKNDIFSGFIQRRKDDWETGTEETHESLVQVANTKYNNMVMQGNWKNVDGKDSKMVALITKVNDLEEKLKNKTSTSNQQTPGQPSNKKNSIEDFRMKYVGDSIVVDGKTWHWCKRHKKEGVYDGLYVTHREDDHDDWLDRKNNWKNKKRSATAPTTTSTSGATPSADKLTLSNNLKAAMITNFQCTADQAEKLWSEVVQDSVK